MASTKVCKLQLPEVYDIARKVGEEFQHIIGEFGGRCVATLVPTVVEALEYLEIYVEEYQTLQTRNYKLLLENDSLAMEREQRIRLATENEVSKRSEIYGVYTYIPMSDDSLHTRHTSPSHLVLLIRFYPELPHIHWKSGNIMRDTRSLDYLHDSLMHSGRLIPLGNLVSDQKLV